MNTTTSSPAAGPGAAPGPEPAAGAIVEPAVRPAGRDGVLRIGLHLLLAALPLLAISAHVFGLVTMNRSAALLILPLAVGVVVLTVFSPRVEDRVIVHGFVWGMIACAVYDAFRLDTVYMLGWWADFIPTMGTWITGDPSDRVGGAVVGYLWRYVGDGGGIGIAFFVAASALGLHHRPRRTVVLVCVAFAVFPVWTGLVATVAIAPRGQQMMFPITATTLSLSLIGHLIFGLILGLGFWRSRAVQQHWPWEPVGGVRHRLALPAAAPARPALPGPSTAGLSFGAAPWSGERSGAGDVARDEPTRGALRTGAITGLEGAVTPAATGSGPLVVPPPPPMGLPAQAGGPQLPADHPSGPQPALSSGPQPVVSGAQPVVGAGRSAPASRHGATAERGSSATGTTVVPRAAHTPPSGETMGPETFELWQRQLATTVKGRRTHRWR